MFMEDEEEVGKNDEQTNTPLASMVISPPDLAGMSEEEKTTEAERWKGLGNRFMASQVCCCFYVFLRLRKSYVCIQSSFVLAPALLR